MCCCDKSNNVVKGPDYGMTVNPNKAARTSEDRGPATTMEAQTRSAIDPVCGMKVDSRKAAVTAKHQGTTFYFCCQGCATRFGITPEKYLETKQPVVGSHASTNERP